MQNERVPHLVIDGTYSTVPSTQLDAEPAAHPVRSAPAPQTHSSGEAVVQTQTAGHDYYLSECMSDHCQTSENGGGIPGYALMIVLFVLACVIARGILSLLPLRPCKQCRVNLSGPVMHGIPSPAPAPFGSPAMAALALAHEQTAYWQQLLAAFAAAIEAEGFTFGTDAGEKVALPYDTRALAGAAIVKARSRHISPQRSEADLEDFLLQAARDGYAGSWADWCQRGAEAAGWYVIRREVNPLTDRGSTE
jgi:hypothetical protein